MENTVFTSMPIRDLEEKLGQIVESKLREFFNGNLTSIVAKEEKYLTRTEVAKALRISLPTLNTLTKSHILKSYRIGRRVLYKLKEIEASFQEVSSSKYRRQ